MFRIRRFGVLRTATVVAVMYAIVIAIILIPVLLILAAVGPGRTTGADAGALIGGVALGGILLLLLYAVVGWIFTALACVVYNVAARFTGSIEVEVERAPDPPGPARWGPPAPPLDATRSAPAAPPQSAVQQPPPAPWDRQP